jgi:hypothetical protein
MCFQLFALKLIEIAPHLIPHRTVNYAGKRTGTQGNAILKPSSNPFFAKYRLLFSLRTVPNSRPRYAQQHQSQKRVTRPEAKYHQHKKTFVIR